MRADIVEAAVHCDYEGLDLLALDGSPTFNYSFGEPSESPGARPGAYWEEQEERDEPVLATMVRLFRLPYAQTTIDEAIFVWPSAAGEGPSDEDWAAVEREFGIRTVEGWRSPEGYLGPRIGVTTRGDWIFYVAGD
jgi:hypothetical protein